jgi:hypothetical protein
LLIFILCLDDFTQSKAVSRSKAVRNRDSGADKVVSRLRTKTVSLTSYVLKVVPSAALLE